MKKHTNYLHRRTLFISFLLMPLFTYSQEIVPGITVRVDTSQTAIKEVYDIYKGYLNSKMDSIYANPYWNVKNWEPEDGHCDRSAYLLLSGYEPSDFLNIYPPKILQIDSVDTGRYQIKTLFALESPSDEYKTFTPTAITKLYAVRQADGFKLENLIHYDTRLWMHKQSGFIHYIISPSVKFDASRARKAGKFCRKIAEQFDIEEIPEIDFYLTSHSDELMKLFNFEYVLSYHTGLTLKFKNEIYSSYGDPLYKHELVHMLLSGKTLIINEGLATWLAGPGANETFEEALKILSKQFQHHRPKSLQEIMNFTYRNKFDNNVIYVTGAVICEMAYDKKGVSGVKALLKCNEDTFKKTMEAVFGQPFCEIEQTVIDFIVEYNR